MLWDVDPAVWRGRACAIVGRNLSREEWKLYLPAGTAVSRHVLGVALRLTRSFGGSATCQTVRNCSLRATTVGPPGDRRQALQTGTLY